MMGNGLTMAAELVLAHKDDASGEGGAAREYAEDLILAYSVEQAARNAREGSGAVPVKVQFAFDDKREVYALDGVVKAFGVRMCFNDGVGTVTLIGYQTDIDAAGVMWDLIAPQLATEMAAPRCKTLGFAQTYGETVRNRLELRIRELPQYDAAVWAARKAAVEQAFRRLAGRVRSRSASFDVRGMAAGARADLGGRRGRVNASPVGALAA